MSGPEIITVYAPIREKPFISQTGALPAARRYVVFTRHRHHPANPEWGMSEPGEVRIAEGDGMAGVTRTRIGSNGKPETYTPRPGIRVWKGDARIARMIRAGRLVRMDDPGSAPRADDPDEDSIESLGLSQTAMKKLRSKGFETVLEIAAAIKKGVDLGAEGPKLGPNVFDQLRRELESRGLVAAIDQSDVKD